MTLGEVLDGDRMAISMYRVQFKGNLKMKKILQFYLFTKIKFILANIENAVLCKVTLKNSEIEQLRSAIEELFYFEFVAGKLFSLKIILKFFKKKLLYLKFSR